MSSASQLDRFLRRIHRRWIAVRAVERAGICMLIACTIALVFSLILIGRGESAMEVVWICLGLGLVVGVAIGWITRPTLLAAAMEVDRQLGLADLLMTALVVRRNRTVRVDSLDQQWAATILLLAEARCVQIQREPLMLRRLGARAWGGIGICTAIVLTLGVLSGNPLLLQAKDIQTQSPFDAAHASIRSRTTSPAPDRAAVQSDPREREAESANTSRIKSRDADTNSDNAAKVHENPISTGVSPNKSGSGAERTNEIAAHSLIRGAADAHAGQTGDLASGGGVATDNGVAGQNASGVEADHSHVNSAAPWQSDRWPEAQRRADEETRNGNIPDEYRDLVRDYFRRQ